MTVSSTSIIMSALPMASRFQGVNNWVLLQKAKHNRAQRFGNLFDAGKQLLTQRTINVKMPPAKLSLTGGINYWR